MSIVVRDATDGDTAAIHGIYAHHVLHGLASFEEIAPSAGEIDRRRRDVLDRGFPYIVAEESGSVLGYAYVTLYRTRSAYRYTVENSVYVRHDLVARGVGRALLGELITRCENLPVRQMIAVIGDSGNAASIGLHAAMGFEHIGILPNVGFKFGRWVDSVLMQRAIGSGARSPPD